MRWLSFAFAALMLAGCPDLSRFCIEGVDCREPVDASMDVRRDVSGDVSEDATGRDTNRPPSVCDLPVACNDCPLPWLLVATRDITTDSRCGGRVHRFTLRGQDEVPCACEGFDGAGDLPTDLRAVGFLAPDKIIVGHRNGVTLLDANTDRVLWDQPVETEPIDVVGIRGPAGEDRVMVGEWGRTASSAIARFRSFNASDGSGETVQRANVSGLGLNILSFSYDPQDPSQIRTVKTGTHSARDVNPFSLLQESQTHVRPRDGYYLKTISSLYDGRTSRTVWSGTRSDLGGDEHRVWQFIGDSFDYALGAAGRCDEGDDRLPYDVDCEYVHAVPDANTPQGAFAICEHWVGGDTVRRIVQLRTTRTQCRTVVEPYLGGDMQYYQMAIAIDPLWE